jgi:hypothetical protein
LPGGKRPGQACSSIISLLLGPRTSFKGPTPTTMSLVAVVQHTVSPAQQVQAQRKQTPERRQLPGDQASRVYIPLRLDATHNVKVRILIQPFTLRQFPGCTFFAVEIEEIVQCCSTLTLDAICDRVDNAIGHFYPQVTICASQLTKTRISLLDTSW